MKPGPRNLISDVNGILIGNAQDEKVRSGVTVILPAARTVAACDVRGGAPGTRETDALDPASLSELVDGIVLSGGSVYGLDAASGAVAWLGARGRGIQLAGAPRVAPVVPAAILFDLASGGDKDWGLEPPYRALAQAACESAGADFALGKAGAGLGARAGDIEGGLGSASLVTGDGLQIGALMAVNAFGSALIPGTHHFWAAPFERGAEFGGRGWPALGALPDDAFAGTRLDLPGRHRPAGHTTIGAVAVNAKLTRVEARRIAVMAQDGVARALRPVHTPVDGDVIFVLATGAHSLPSEDRVLHVMRLGALAADCVARAVARGVYEANAKRP